MFDNGSESGGDALTWRLRCSTSRTIPNLEMAAFRKSKTAAGKILKNNVATCSKNTYLQNKRASLVVEVKKTPQFTVGRTLLYFELVWDYGWVVRGGKDSSTSFSRSSWLDSLKSFGSAPGSNKFVEPVKPIRFATD